jgi:hypothetical protein
LKRIGGVDAGEDRHVLGHGEDFAPQLQQVVNGELLLL